MTTLQLSSEADADVVAILLYESETFGWEAAEAYVESFDSAFDLLIRHPQTALSMRMCAHRSAV